MAIPSKTIKSLYAKSGNICAFPGCNCPLVEKSNQSQIAHIISQQKNGPRHIDGYNGGNYDIEDNLILLCSIHHHLIDDNPDDYPIEWLREIKKDHEEYISKSLQLSSTDQNFINDFLEICQANHIEEIICSLPIGASFYGKLLEYEYICYNELIQLLQSPQSVRINKDILSELFNFIYTLNDLYRKVAECYIPNPSNADIFVLLSNTSSETLYKLREIQEWLIKTYSKYRFTNL